MQWNTLGGKKEINHAPSPPPKQNQNVTGEGKTKLRETPEAQITSHQTQSGHCYRVLGGWRLLLNILLLCVEEDGSWSPCYDHL